MVRDLKPGEGATTKSSKRSYKAFLKDKQTSRLEKAVEEKKKGIRKDVSRENKEHKPKLKSVRFGKEEKFYPSKFAAVKGKCEDFFSCEGANRSILLTSILLLLILTFVYAVWKLCSATSKLERSSNGETTPLNLSDSLSSGIPRPPVLVRNKPGAVVHLPTPKKLSEKPENKKERKKNLSNTAKTVPKTTATTPSSSTPHRKKPSLYNKNIDTYNRLMSMIYGTNRYVNAQQGSKRYMIPPQYRPDTPSQGTTPNNYIDDGSASHLSTFDYLVMKARPTSNAQNGRAFIPWNTYPNDYGQINQNNEPFNRDNDASYNGYGGKLYEDTPPYNPGLNYNGFQPRYPGLSKERLSLLGLEDPNVVHDDIENTNSHLYPSNLIPAVQNYEYPMEIQSNGMSNEYLNQGMYKVGNDNIKQTSGDEMQTSPAPDTTPLTEYFTKGPSASIKKSSDVSVDKQANKRTETNKQKSSKISINVVVNIKGKNVTVPIVLNSTNLPISETDLIHSITTSLNNTIGTDNNAVLTTPSTPTTGSTTPRATNSTVTTKTVTTTSSTTTTITTPITTTTTTTTTKTAATLTMKTTVNLPNVDYLFPTVSPTPMLVDNFNWGSLNAMHMAREKANGPLQNSLLMRLSPYESRSPYMKLIPPGNRVQLMPIPYDRGRNRFAELMTTASPVAHSTGKVYQDVPFSFSGSESRMPNDLAMSEGQDNEMEGRLEEDVRNSLAAKKLNLNSHYLKHKKNINERKHGDEIERERNNENGQDYESGFHEQTNSHVVVYKGKRKNKKHAKSESSKIPKKATRRKRKRRKLLRILKKISSKVKKRKKGKKRKNRKSTARKERKKKKQKHSVARKKKRKRKSSSKQNGKNKRKHRKKSKHKEKPSQNWQEVNLRVKNCSLFKKFAPTNIVSLRRMAKQDGKHVYEVLLCSLTRKRYGSGKPVYNCELKTYKLDGYMFLRRKKLWSGYEFELYVCKSWEGLNVLYQKFQGSESRGEKRNNIEATSEAQVDKTALRHTQSIDDWLSDKHKSKHSHSSKRKVHFKPSHKNKRTKLRKYSYKKLVREDKEKFSNNLLQRKQHQENPRKTKSRSRDKDKDKFSSISAEEDNGVDYIRVNDKSNRQALVHKSNRYKDREQERDDEDTDETKELYGEDQTRERHPKLSSRRFHLLKLLRKRHFDHGGKRRGQHNEALLRINQSLRKNDNDEDYVNESTRRIRKAKSYEKQKHKMRITKSVNPREKYEYAAAKKGQRHTIQRPNDDTDDVNMDDNENQWDENSAADDDDEDQRLDDKHSDESGKTFRMHRETKSKQKHRSRLKFNSHRPRKKQILDVSDFEEDLSKRSYDQDKDKRLLSDEDREEGISDKKEAEMANRQGSEEDIDQTDEKQVLTKNTDNDKELSENEKDRINSSDEGTYSNQKRSNIVENRSPLDTDPSGSDEQRTTNEILPNNQVEYMDDDKEEKSETSNARRKENSATFGDIGDEDTVQLVAKHSIHKNMKPRKHKNGKRGKMWGRKRDSVVRKRSGRTTNQSLQRRNVIPRRHSHLRNHFRADIHGHKGIKRNPFVREAMHRKSSSLLYDQPGIEEEDSSNDALVVSGDSDGEVEISGEEERNEQSSKLDFSGSGHKTTFQDRHKISYKTAHDHHRRKSPRGRQHILSPHRTKQHIKFLRQLHKQWNGRKLTDLVQKRFGQGTKKKSKQVNAKHSQYKKRHHGSKVTGMIQDLMNMVSNLKTRLRGDSKASLGKASDGNGKILSTPSEKEVPPHKSSDTASGIQTGKSLKSLSKSSNTDTEESVKQMIQKILPDVLHNVSSLKHDHDHDHVPTVSPLKKSHQATQAKHQHKTMPPTHSRSSMHPTIRTKAREVMGTNKKFHTTTPTTAPTKHRSTRPSHPKTTQRQTPKRTTKPKPTSMQLDLIVKGLKALGIKDILKSSPTLGASKAKTMIKHPTKPKGTPTKPKIRSKVSTASIPTKPPVPHPVPLHTPNQLNILCFGDSITAGYYNHGKAFFPYGNRLSTILTQNLRSSVSVKTKGVVGEMTHKQMTSRLPLVLGNMTKVDWAIILGGTNDILHVKNFADDQEFLGQLENVWQPRITKDIEKLHKIAYEYGAHTVLLTVPENSIELWPGYKILLNMRKRINDALRKFAYESKGKTVLCDFAKKFPRHSLTQDMENLYWDDHLHLTPAGYNRMADIVFKCLKPYLPPRIVI